MFIAIMAFVVVLGRSEAQQSSGNTQWLYEQCKSPNSSRQNSCMAYLLGAADVMSGIGSVYEGAKTPTEKDFYKQLAVVGMCGSPASAGMLRQVFINWAEKNPAQWPTYGARGNGCAA
jgi:hypothetical protein